MEKVKFSSVDLITAQTKEAIRRKSAANLPDAPRERSYTPSQIKGALVRPMLDTKDSVAAEIDRVAVQVNRALREVEEAMSETPDETGAMQPGSGIGAVAQLGGNVASGMQSAALGKESYAASPIGTTEGYLTTVVPCTRYLTDEVSMDYDAATRKLTFTYVGDGDAPQGKVFVVYRCYITELDNYIYRRAMLDALPAEVDLSAEGTVDADTDGSLFTYLMFAGEVDGEVMDGTVTKESLYAPRAVGYATVAVGKGAEASGYLTVAWKPCAHAEGYRTRAMGDAAHAEGAATLALADRSHAEGIETHAIGGAAHAEGKSTMANGFCSHAEGVGTISDAFAGHVQGCYNEIDADKKYLHIVGNGSSEAKRSNAHTLDKEGNAWFAGAVACAEPRADGEAATRRYVENRISGKLTDWTAFLQCVPDENDITAVNASFVPGAVPSQRPNSNNGSYVTSEFFGKNAIIVYKKQRVPKDASATGQVGIWVRAENLCALQGEHNFLPVDIDWKNRLSSLSGETVVANADKADASFIDTDGNSGTNANYRFCDRSKYVIYKVDLATYPNALVVMDVCQNYLIQVSADKATWTTVQNYEIAAGGRVWNDSNKVQIAISAAQFASGASVMYIKLANTNSTDGFGGATSGFTIYTDIVPEAMLRIELTDSGKPDVGEICYELKAQKGTLIDGWNFYKFDLLHSANSGLAAIGTIGYAMLTDTMPDLKRLNYCRVYGSWTLWRIGVGTCAVIRRAVEVEDSEFILPSVRTARGKIIGTGRKLTLTPGFIPSRIVLRASHTATYNGNTYTQEIYESFTLSPARDGEYFFIYNASDYLGSFTDVRGGVWSFSTTDGGQGVTMMMENGFYLTGVTYDFYAEE